ncbi:hemicentin-1-like [Tigriopus californicus]|uniref:hemicentin-1-like n=1 Tax=Tigriopus californicus TaxID=6832 RepID=UPI0027DA08F8|nr:hemicentin-1-like [Tigriopus californicus]
MFQLMVASPVGQMAHALRHVDQAPCFKRELVPILNLNLAAKIAKVHGTKPLIVTTDHVQSKLLYSKVDGGFSEWVDGACSVSCGSGTMLQKRTCSNPEPKFGGRYCQGSFNQTVSCQLDPCPIHGGFSDWHNGPCSVSCGTGSSVQTRDCSNPVPRFGGRSCHGILNQVVPCTLDPCPVHGGFNEWLNGTCSTTCGTGQLIQIRECSNPIPRFGGRNCEGVFTRLIPCEMDPCPVNGGFSDWDNGPCSVSCGAGRMVQTRTCSNPTPQNGGKDCQGESKQIVPCILDQCPVHGRFSEWTNGPCSVSCGKGKMVQTRTCSKPAPQHGGRDCVGATFQISECIRPECPSKLDSFPCLDFGHIYVPQSAFQFIESSRVHFAQTCLNLCLLDPNCRFSTYRRNVCSMFRGSYMRKRNRFVISSDTRNC